MPPLSFKLRPDCIEIAKAARKQSKYSTQISLGIEADIQAQSTVSNFFCGKPIERTNFNKLCELLKLDPIKVREKPLSSIPAAKTSTVSAMATICRSEENAWCQRLFEPHALIRLQAPAQFGKTSLMWKMLDRAEQQGHLALYLNLNAIDLASFKDAQAFFRAIVCEIASEIEEQYLDQLMPLSEYDLLVNQNTPSLTFLKYLERLQQNIVKPLTIGINKLDRLLDFPNTADEFLFQLRNMNEKTKKRGVWQNFRLILAYSTPRIEEFVTVLANRSPFNVGETIKLTEFNSSEIGELATKKGLNLDPAQIVQIMKSIGGIPILVQLTLDRLRQPAADSDTIAPIYQEHLATLELWLQQRHLAILMQQIATNPTAVTLTRQQYSLLHRQGLIISVDRQIHPRCELYRQFFAQSQS
jgi:hypothetical protein